MELLKGIYQIYIVFAEVIDNMNNVELAFKHIGFAGQNIFYTLLFRFFFAFLEIFFSVFGLLPGLVVGGNEKTEYCDG